MKNMDFYKSTFSQVRTKKEIRMEDFEKMKMNKDYENETISVLEKVKSRKKTNMRRLAIFVTVTCVLATSIGIIYMLNGLGMINGPLSTSSPAEQIGEETDLTESAILHSTLEAEASSIQSDIEISMTQIEETTIQPERTYTIDGHRLDDVFLQENPTIEHMDPSNPSPNSSISYDMISLQGYSDSVEYKAALEWFDFENECDIEAALATNYSSSKYFSYSVYSQEMADKLEEIIAKYQLNIHTGWTEMGSFDEIYSKTGKSEFFNAGSTSGRGYIYDDGTFQMDSDTRLPSGVNVSYQIRNNVKGVLDTVFLNIGDRNEYIGWNYETSSGISVLLATSSSKSLLFADLENSFVTVNIMDGISEEALEEFADSINFDAIT